MIVMKFGGTSVGSVDAISRVAGIVKTHYHLQPIVVVSAMSKVTDTLRDIAEEACRGHDPKDRVEALRRRHEVTINALIDQEERAFALATCFDMIDELENICHGIMLLQELSPRSIDLVSSFGERLSAPIVATALRAHDVPSVPVDAREYIKTDERYTEAEVDFLETKRRLSSGLKPLINDGQVPVITGFVGSTSEGVTTTLGRGASDYTASIVGSVLKTDEIWIWTDVDGAMTADPRIVANARVLENISYHEAAEMSYFGAKVLHPKTMLPAVQQQIPIRIRNTFNPAEPGTLISGDTMPTTMGVKAVTSIDQLCLIMIEGGSLIGIPDTPARLFKTTAEHKIPIIMITQASSEHDICLLINEKNGNRIVAALKTEFRHELDLGSLETISVQPNLAAVAVVGQGMKGTPGIAARTFGILGEHGINIIAIAQGSSELNISFVVARSDLQRAVQLVHDSFELSGKGVS
ncbi:MAG: aspartate kinase [Candidatus Latescibacteria bacterium]|nr:aspartate kinase [Candidatus Latescibacterota bacterium]